MNDTKETTKPDDVKGEKTAEQKKKVSRMQRIHELAKPRYLSKSANNPKKPTEKSSEKPAKPLVRSRSTLIKPKNDSNEEKRRLSSTGSNRRTSLPANQDTAKTANDAKRRTTLGFTRTRDSTAKPLPKPPAALPPKKLDSRTSRSLNSSKSSDTKPVDFKQKLQEKSQLIDDLRQKLDKVTSERDQLKAELDCLRKKFQQADHAEPPTDPQPQPSSDEEPSAAMPAENSHEAINGSNDHILLEPVADSDSKEVSIDEASTPNEDPVPEQVKE